MGLNAAKIGDSSVEHAVNNRLASTHTGNIKDYYRLLQSDNKELRELIEEIVVQQ